MESADHGLSIDIKPGLIGLNLDVMHALDLQVIQEAILTIQKLCDKEHPIVHNVQKNLIAILKMKVPKERCVARRELEVIARDPHVNLNALADLELLYRDLHRNTDADECKNKIKEIVSSNSDTSFKYKQTCLLEQGYIILVERTLINQRALENRINDLTKILTTEKERSTGSRKKTFERSIHHQMQVLRNVENANEEGKTDGDLTRKGSSLQKFNMALDLGPSSDVDVVWHYYHAKAFNQYYDTLENNSSNNDDLVPEMTDVTMRAVEIFWGISQHSFRSIEHELKRIVARSYAYLGHILVKRQNLVESHIDNYKITNMKYFKTFLSEPLKASEMAYRICKRDTVVLTRYGRSLWNKSQQCTGEKHKLLVEAHRILSSCLQIDPTRNWFALSSRMVVTIDRYGLAMKSNKQLAHKLLEDARKDGLELFKSHCTQKDMVKLADVCQKLAKFPTPYLYGPDVVRCKLYLHEALDYLYYGMSLGERPDSHWLYRKASCMYDLGEYYEAVEWQKKAWLLSKQTFTDVFFLLCVFMIRLILRESDVKVIKELLYVLSYGKNKYGDKFDDLLVRLMQKEEHGVLNILHQVVVEKKFSMRKQEKDILKDCVQVWKRMSLKPKSSNELSIAEIKLHEIEEISVTPYGLYEIFHNTSLEPVIKELEACSPDHEYDFFISHSHKDMDWVTNILLPNLESKFDDQDVAFKGCIADRDFIPGKSVVTNIVDTIAKSYKVILVLSKHFVSSNWCDYEADQAIMKGLNLKSDDVDDDIDAVNENTYGYNCVIPIMLEPCKVPQKIFNLNYIDMTIERDFVTEMMRLKRALLPRDTISYKSMVSR